jgi:hypothetical protein
MSPAAVQVKAIKPERFKDEAFTTAMWHEANKVADDMLLDFTYTTSSWEHDVKFENVTQVTGAAVEVLVGTGDKIYGYVNDGTEPHTIWPRFGNKALRFQWGGKGSYKPKTVPRRISSGPGGPTGPMVHKAYVQHPGTTARQFDKTIEKKWRLPFRRRMERAMAKGATASGHGIP